MSVAAYYQDDEFTDIPSSEWKSYDLEAKVIKAVNDDYLQFGEIKSAEKSLTHFRIRAIFFRGKSTVNCDCSISIKNPSNKACSCSSVSGRNAYSHTETHTSYSTSF